MVSRSENRKHTYFFVLPKITNATHRISTLSIIKLDILVSHQEYVARWFIEILQSEPFCLAMLWYLSQLSSNVKYCAFLCMSILWYVFNNIPQYLMNVIRKNVKIIEKGMWPCLRNKPTLSCQLVNLYTCTCVCIALITDNAQGAG